MKALLSKENFVNAIQGIEQWYDNTNKLYDEFGIDVIDMKIPHLDEVIHMMLNEIFDDYENDWIGWWCYDTEFGRIEDNAVVYEEGEDGTEEEIRIKTAEDLYDFLIKLDKEKNRWLN